MTFNIRKYRKTMLCNTYFTKLFSNINNKTIYIIKHHDVWEKNKNITLLFYDYKFCKLLFIYTLLKRILRTVKTKKKSLKGIPRGTNILFRV